MCTHPHIPPVHTHTTPCMHTVHISMHTHILYRCSYTCHRHACITHAITTCMCVPTPSHTPTTSSPNCTVSGISSPLQLKLSQALPPLSLRSTSLLALLLPSRANLTFSDLSAQPHLRHGPLQMTPAPFLELCLALLSQWLALGCREPLQTGEHRAAPR